MSNVWIWLALGLVPYDTHWQSVAGHERILEIRALFWSFRMHQQGHGFYGWKIRIPLIEHSRNAIWAAVLKLQETMPSQS
jgi:hypothetical protein